MKRGKKLLLMLLAFGILAGAAATAGRLNLDAVPEAEAAVSVLQIDPETVTCLAWTYGEEMPEFTKSDNGWVYAQDAAFPADQTKLDSILVTLSDVTAYKTIENAEGLAQYGLETPACTVRVTAEDMTTTITIGDATSLDSYRYLSTGDGNVYLADETVLENFSYGLYDLLVTEEIPDLSTATGICVEAQTQSMKIEKLEESGLCYSDAYVWFLNDGGEYEALDNELVSSFLSEICALSWEKCVDFHAEEADMGQYGLDVPSVTVAVDYMGAVDVETEYTDGNGDPVILQEDTPMTFTLEIGSYVDSACYARIAGSSMVYRIDGTFSDALMYTTADSLRPDEAVLLDWDTVTAMDIVLDGETYTITRQLQQVTDGEGSETEETVYLLSGREVAAENVLDSLDAVTSNGYAGAAEPARGEEIRFVFYRDSEAYPQVELTFYTYDSASCLTQLNGASTIFADRDGVVALVEAVNSLVLE